MRSEPTQGRRPVANERHGEKRVAVHDLEVVDRQDVGMVELGQGLGLRLEAFDEAFVLEQLGRQRLQSDLAAERLLDGAVDDGHAAPAEALDDLVLAQPGAGQVLHFAAASAWTIEIRSARRNGLLNTLSAPAARNLSRSLAIEWALAMTIGRPGTSVFMRRIASSPSMPGIATSIRIIAGFWPSAMSTACSPSAAISTAYPAFSSTRLHRRCATSLSSATRTVNGRGVVPFGSAMAELHGVGVLRRQRDREVE